MLNVLSVAQMLQQIDPNDYPVYPEQEGEWDRPINPYSPH